MLCLLLKVCHISAPQQLRFFHKGGLLDPVRSQHGLVKAQWWYLERKFKVGQETGLKLDPVDVARDMRYARNQQGAKLFTVDEFLTVQQIQSYFSRTASKLRHLHSDDPESEQDEDVLAETHVRKSAHSGLRRGGTETPNCF